MLFRSFDPPGIRTSIYNAVTLAQVETVAAFMNEFEAEHRTVV